MNLVAWSQYSAITGLIEISKTQTSVYISKRLITIPPTCYPVIKVHYGVPIKTV